MVQHRAHPGAWLSPGHALGAALPRDRCDAALCCALSLRTARRDPLGRLERGRQHAVDREDAPAFPRPSALRVPALQPSPIARLNRPHHSFGSMSQKLLGEASGGGNGLKLSGLSPSICSGLGTCEASQPPPSAWISATLAVNRFCRMPTAVTASVSAVVSATMTLV